MSKKYYDLLGQRVVACLDWKKGYGTIEEAKKVLGNNIREISKSEFKRLGEIYTTSDEEVTNE